MGGRPRAVQSVGGFLGMGKHRVAIPVGQFTSMTPRIVRVTQDGAGTNFSPFSERDLVSASGLPETAST